MSKILTITFVFLQLYINAQSLNKCNCQAFIDLNFKNEIIVYDKPNGITIKKLKHDFKNEDYLTLDIHNDTVGFFQIDISNAIKGKYYHGWIKKSNLINVYTRFDKTALFSNPDIKSKINFIIPQQTNEVFIIENCKDKWVYGRIKYNGRFIKGWLQYSDQCPAIYTTCN